MLEALSAIATTVAVVVALAIGVTAEVRVLGDRKRARASAISEQAERISAWLEVRLESGTTTEEQMHGVYAVAQNNSAEPIWEVVVSYPPIFSDGSQAAYDDWTLAVLPPGSREKRVELAASQDALACIISFRDNAGADWSRGHDGRLVGRRAKEFPPQYP